MNPCEVEEFTMPVPGNAISVDWCRTHSRLLATCRFERLAADSQEAIRRRDYAIELLREARLIVIECGRRDAYDSRADNSFNRFIDAVDRLTRGDTP